VSGTVGPRADNPATRFLTTSTQIDANGIAHVWARYVFYYKGATSHCGYES
jgi:hypothetical protein